MPFVSHQMTVSDKVNM